jgi:hypothetical protein
MVSYREENYSPFESQVPYMIFSTIHFEGVWQPFCVESETVKRIQER